VLPEYRLGKAVEQVLDGVGRSADSDFQLGLITAVAPYLTSEQQIWAIELAQRFEVDWQRLHALTALAPHLSGALVNTVFDASGQLSRTEHRCPVLLALLTRASGEQRGAILDSALDAARGIGLSYNRAMALAKIAAVCDANLRSSIGTEALEVLNRVSGHSVGPHPAGILIPLLDHDQRAALLAAVRTWYELDAAFAMATGVVHLYDDEIDATFEWATTLSREDARQIVLAALAPRLPAFLVDRALAMADLLERDSGRLAVLAALAPRLNREQLIDALRIARGIRDGKAQARCLASVAVATGQAELRDAAVWDALRVAERETDMRRGGALASAAAVIGVEHMSAALVLCKQVISSSERARIIVAMTARLSPSQREDALVLAQGIDSEPDRTVVVAALASPSNLTQIAAEGKCDMSLATENARWQLLNALKHRRDPKATRALAENALRTARLEDASRMCADPLQRCSSCFDPLQMSQAIELAKTIPALLNRAFVFSSLAPYMSYEQVSEVIAFAKTQDKSSQVLLLRAVARYGTPMEIDEILHFAVTMIDEDDRRSLVLNDRSELLEELAPCLDDRQIGDVLGVLDSIENEVMRLRILGGLAENVASSRAREILDRLLDQVATTNRAEALWALARAAPLSLALGGEAALDEIRRAIVDVAQWYS
jgi:hypothetical protein